MEAGIHPVLNLKPCYFLVVTLHWRGAQSVSQAAADDQNVGVSLAAHLLLPMILDNLADTSANDT